MTKTLLFLFVIISGDHIYIKKEPMNIYQCFSKVAFEKSAIRGTSIEKKMKFECRQVPKG